MAAYQSGIMLGYVPYVYLSADIGASYTPYLSSLKDGQECVTNHNYVVGYDGDGWDRAGSCAGAGLPVVSHGMIKTGVLLLGGNERCT